MVLLDSKTDRRKVSYQYRLGGKLRGAAEEPLSAPKTLCMLRQRVARKTAKNFEGNIVAFQSACVRYANKKVE